MHEKQIKNTMIYMIPIIVGNLFPFITMPIFTRILTPEDYGVLALAIVYSVLINSFANIGLTNSYERNFFQYKEKKENYQLLYSTITFVVLLTSLLLFITYIFKGFIARKIIGSAIHADLLFWATCSTCILSLKTYMLSYFRNTEQAKEFSKFLILEGIFSLFFSLLFVVFLRTGVIGLPWSQVCGGGLIFLILTFKFIRTYPYSFNLDILKDTLKLSYPLIPKLLLSWFSSQIDKYIIGLLKNEGAVGIYSLGQKLSYFIFTFMTAIQNVFSPQVFKYMFMDDEKSRVKIGKYLTPFLYFSIAFALGVSLFSQELFVIMTPESYHGAIDIAIVLSMYYGGMFFAKIPQILYARKTYITSIMSVVDLSLTIILIIPFAMKWGAIGAAWATFIEGLICNIINFIIGQKCYRIIWEYSKIFILYGLFYGSSIAIITMRSLSMNYYVLITFKMIIVILFIFYGNRINILVKDNFIILKNMLDIRRIAS